MPLPNCQTRGRHIILFGRYPVPGYTKTRLIPLMGPLGAADFQRWMTEKMLDTLVACSAAPVTFCHFGGRAHQLRRWLAPYPIRYASQVMGSLGERMQAAMAAALSQCQGPVLLLGTDVPQLTPDAIFEAFHALEDHDLVLGPSPDGGYWLVGCRRPVAIFEGIAWGTSRVLAQTLAAARGQGLKVKQLSPMNDMDTPGDLRAWLPENDWQRPYLSVVIPTLNEADHIAHAIARVQGPDNEVLVADGGSRDSTVNAARRAGARVITTSPGRAIQQNKGAARAKGRVVLFLHADTRLAPDFGRHIFECLLDRRVIAGAFRFKTDFDHWGMALIEKCAHLRAKVFQMPYGDQALFMQRDVFIRSGGFPPTPIAEDLLLVRKLAKSGSIRIVPADAVTSARRWQSLGLVRTTLINYFIAGACLLGVAPQRLAPLYQSPVPEQRNPRDIES